MAYTREQFGKELKKLLSNKEPIEVIGHWALIIFMHHVHEVDKSFKNIILTLNMMEDGPEFAYSYEELHQIADDLIEGREVKL